MLIVGVLRVGSVTLAKKPMMEPSRLSPNKNRENWMGNPIGVKLYYMSMFLVVVREFLGGGFRYFESKGLKPPTRFVVQVLS